MGLYFRTVEMSRHLRFRCFRCAAPMQERLVGPMELELTCPTPSCLAMVLVITRQAIPRSPDDLRGVVRYKTGGAPLDHAGGFRCHNCGRRISYDAQSRGPHQCSRCRTWHMLGTVSAPPHRPRVLHSASGASSSPVVTPASFAR